MALLLSHALSPRPRGNLAPENSYEAASLNTLCVGNGVQVPTRSDRVLHSQRTVRFCVQVMTPAGVLMIGDS